MSKDYLAAAPHEVRRKDRAVEDEAWIGEMLRVAPHAVLATVHEGQKFLFAANDAKTTAEVPAPYTIGLWQPTPPVEVILVKGQNVLHVALKEGSRGVAIKDFTLTPVK